ncbi:MAG TPA: hypothetical protein EYO58_07690 [Flavobacteriales bacterium]|nr:hypothetical protein [Flavobacteriales bacterium]
MKYTRIKRKTCSSVRRRTKTSSVAKRKAQTTQRRLTSTVAKRNVRSSFRRHQKKGGRRKVYSRRNHALVRYTRGGMLSSIFGNRPTQYSKMKELQKEAERLREENKEALQKEIAINELRGSGKELFTKKEGLSIIQIKESLKQFFNFDPLEMVDSLEGHHTTTKSRNWDSKKNKEEQATNILNGNDIETLSSILPFFG